ncbi:hypothetical protein SAMN05421747_12715 [Parapedobacter composti]|uniref:Tfp pilus assembly protein PilN n=2 Tax=Parapedobacter composti TaxID=623281 RepID=A0A1I1M9F4_9SPHI|nr:hypothetical protein SAMN05421747_12715 [Parapedobacter composti]
MFAVLTSYLRHIPQVVGVELLLAEGDVLVANLVVVRRAGTKVHFVRGEYGLGSYSAIAAHVPAGVPMMVAMGGKGVIHRSVARGAGEGDEALLRQVLPNAKPDDFYVQSADLEGIHMVSVARRTQVDDVIGALQAQGLVLLGAGLGPFAVDFFREFLMDEKREVLALWRHRFTLHGGKIAGYELLPDDSAVTARRVELGGEQLNERLVPAFAVAFVAISDIPFAQLPVAALQTSAAECRGKWAFRRSAVAVMVFFLVVLLGNALYFMHYSDKVAGFAGSDALDIQREINKLQQQGAERDALLKGLWHADMPRWGMAYMTDRLAASRPASILLTELAVYPKDVAMSRRERRPVHAPSAIRIRGTCTDVPLLNGWMKQLRQLPFCQAVEIDSYEFDGRNGLGIFTLSLTLEP